MAVYVLHFSEPIGESQTGDEEYIPHARHYVGYTCDMDRRIKEHRRGSGGHLCRVAKERGVTIEIAHVWVGAGRGFERYLKRVYKNTPKICPLCSPDGEERAVSVWEGYKRKRGQDAKGSG